MRALRYFVAEAVASLWRGRGAAALAILTIAAGVFVLGFFLMINANLQRLVARWSQTAELSVYLQEGATPEEVAAVKARLTGSGIAQSVEFVSKADARRAFAREFPDLGGAASALPDNPFPASFEVRLTSPSAGLGEAADRLATRAGSMPGVADVRYDRRWLQRLSSLVAVIRGMGLVVLLMLAFASALTVANVVSLAAAARRDEIEIMQLVGAPFAYIRGPFVLEGLLQGGLGALAAVVALVAAFAVLRARYGGFMVERAGLEAVAFVPAALVAGLVVGGMALGCLGGYVVARTVR
ncbi:MAG TPA: permease-like cell division protein FtsX [Vicinamibacterales bacterium]|nr:permease-like cell division protein FtsX [Vicinamibacterales bacterium]